MRKIKTASMCIFSQVLRQGVGLARKSLSLKKRGTLMDLTQSHARIFIKIMAIDTLIWSLKDLIPHANFTRDQQRLCKK